MEIEYGARVKDKNGKVLGKVNNIIRDTWTGEISKFQVTSVVISLLLFIPPKHIDKATPKEIKLKVTLEKLQKET